MKKYGLQLRVPPSQQKKQPTRPPLPRPIGFNDDEDDDVEREISRQASKNKALKDIEDQHKKALEEDPSVFDYDGVYDKMKEKAVLPKTHDRLERKPKYIQKLIEKAKEREREHEIIYEKKLVKERSKDDHLFTDKDKFVTSAYKKKLAEQAKWLEEERLRQLKEEKEDVTKKSDISDFYFNLSKNIAFGAEEAKSNMPEKQKEDTVDMSEKAPPSTNTRLKSSEVRNGYHGDTSTPPKKFDSTFKDPNSDASAEEKSATATATATERVVDEPRRDHHKRNEDAVAAAKERFLARKRAKEQ